MQVVVVGQHTPTRVRPVQAEQEVVVMAQQTVKTARLVQQTLAVEVVALLNITIRREQEALALLF
jgi:hypothetical protein